VKLIIGLGNIGKRYAHTRHNLGFMVTDELAKKLQSTQIHEFNSSLIGKISPPSVTPQWRQEPKLQAEVAEFTLAEDKIILAKPQTMMNLSGEAVQRLMQKYRARPADVWVIFDDLDVPFGRLRIRTAGTSGSGHQGVNSIMSHIGADFVRVKVGISLNDRTTEPSEVYVLKPFTPDEQAKLPILITTAASVVADQLDHPTAPDTTFDLV